MKIKRNITTILTKDEKRLSILIGLAFLFIPLNVLSLVNKLSEWEIFDSINWIQNTLEFLAPIVGGGLCYWIVLVLISLSKIVQENRDLRLEKENLYTVIDRNEDGKIQEYLYRHHDIY